MLLFARDLLFYQLEFLFLLFGVLGVHAYEEMIGLALILRSCRV